MAGTLLAYGWYSSVDSVWAAGIAHDLSKAFKTIEAESGGRLGISVLDTGSGMRVEHRGQERFPMCSTFKLLVAAATLARIDKSQESLKRRIQFTAKDVIDYSPVTEKRVGGKGMSVGELCEAAMTRSDNTAANLLLASLGGPKSLTRYARSLGDQVTRLDRNEPSLNEAQPGDRRDTTTPTAMVSNLRVLIFGNALSTASKDQLTKWLLANKTGDKRLRASLPIGWRVGDKTGSGTNGTTNDVGVLWPPSHTPLIVSSYLTETPAPREKRNATLAAVGKAVAEAFT